MANKTWVIIADDMTIENSIAVSLEAGLPVTALVFGDKERASKVSGYGVESVLWFDTTEVIAEAYESNVAELAVSEKPSVVLGADEPTARSIVGVTAAHLGAPCAAAITNVAVKDSCATIECLVANDQSIEIFECATPVAGCLADGGKEASVGTPAPITAYDEAPLTSIAIVSTDIDEGAAASLAVADRVIGVGLGVGPKDNLQHVYDLAEVLGAEIACSLPLCDNYHWFEHSSVVGTSTQKISPRFYLACGVSGVPQHVLGVKGAKTICAINKDPEAPIFQESAYGILGDMNEVIPALTQAIKSL